MLAPPHSADPLVGAHLDDRYLVTGVLGRGGMGLVYEGTHEQLGRAVAIKVLGPEVGTNAVVVERFLREARIASSLGHGNIVDVSDLGRLEDGRPYLVMPRIGGVDLAILLAREGPMPPHRVAALLCGVAAALDLVHAKGLAHRDVKPENLMHVVREDGSETVMLTDFGIAGLVAAKQARLTGDGMICGTPAYVAPELVSTGEFDGRADVYALAAVAFELMTGQLPFDGPHPARVMAAKVQTPAPPLNSVAGRTFARAVEHVVAHGLAREPDERFQTASAFVAALADAARTEDAGYAHARASRGVAPRPIVAAVLMSIAFLGSWFVPSAEVPDSSRTTAGVLSPATPSVGSEARLELPGAAPQSTVVAQPSEPEPDETRSPASHVARPLRRARVEPTAGAAQPAPSTFALASGADELNRGANQQLLRGQLRPALDLFERATERDPRSEPAYRGLGVVNERIGRRAAAIQAFRRALELEPHGPHVAALRTRLERLEAIR